MKKQLAEITMAQEFVCLGSECPRTCCHGWKNIEIDTETIAKWRSIQDHEQNLTMQAFIDTGDNDIPVMKQSEDNVCTALNEDKLCSIQMQYGHDYLSKVCREFPRLRYENYYRTNKSVSFSCPVIVDNILFDSETKRMFLVSEIDEDNQSSTNHDHLLYKLDVFLGKILDKTEYNTGIILFFISDVFVKILNMSQTGELTDDILDQLQNNIDIYLTDITKSVKRGKLKPNPVTSGSIWKSVYDLCEARKIHKKYLEDDNSKLNQAIRQCSDTHAQYSKIYAVISQYKKSGNKQFKQQYKTLLRKYIQVIFINKGFPLVPKYTPDLVLVDCMINICILQLLMWIEINKNGNLTDSFVKDCIVEVDRKFVMHDGVVNSLKSNTHMMHIEKYCNSFLDIF